MILSDEKRQLKEEKNDWVIIKKDNSINSYKSYLKKYPNGKFSSDAIKRINTLEEKENKRIENIEWDNAKEINSINSYKSYLKKYPNGKFSSDAIKRINILEVSYQTSKIKYLRAFAEILMDLNEARNRIKENISLELIAKSTFYAVRNTPFELSQSKKYCIFPNTKSTKDNNVVEHVNGRTNVGIYALYCTLIGEIKNWKDLYNWYLKYATWIYTTAQFNQAIKPYQNDEGAIPSKIYIDEYEKAYNIKFSDEELLKFKSHFLFDKYGIITKLDIVNMLNNEIE